MARGRARLEWRQTATQLAMFAAAHRRADSSPPTVDMFDPFAGPRQRTEVGIEALSFLLVVEPVTPTGVPRKPAP